MRPHGRPLSEAVYQANLDFCRNQTAGGRGRGDDTPAFKKCMATRGLSTQDDPTPSPVITYNRDSKDPAVGWYWENGSRVCHNDCDNPEIPGSGFTCSDVVRLGMATRKCTRRN